MVIFRWTNPFPWPDGDPIMPLAIKSEDWIARFDDIDRAFMGAIVVLGLIAAADVARRWRRIDTSSRRGLGWLAIGASLMTIAFLPLALPTSWTDWMPAATTPLFHLGSQLFFPGRSTRRRARQRLWGVRLAVSRTLVWSMLTALLIAAYVLLVGLSSLLVPGVDDSVQRVAVTAVVAAAIGPLRRFVQRRVDHLIHGESREPIAARRPHRARHRRQRHAHRTAGRRARRPRHVAASRRRHDRRQRGQRLGPPGDDRRRLG